MSNVVGCVVGRLEMMELEEIINTIKNPHLRPKFLRLYKYMLKDGDEHYLIVRADPEKTSQFIEDSDKEDEKK